MQLRLGLLVVIFLLEGCLLLTETQGRKSDIDSAVRSAKRTPSKGKAPPTRKYVAHTTRRNVAPTTRPYVAPTTPRHGGITTQRHVVTTTQRHAAWATTPRHIAPQPQPMYPQPQPMHPQPQPMYPQPQPMYPQPQPNFHPAPVVIKVKKDKHKNKKNKLKPGHIGAAGAVGAVGAIGLIGLGAAARKPTQFRCPNWMSIIPDSTNISMLSIPGSHGTMARYGGPLVMCHNRNLETQYKVGIRFVDIRTRHYQNSLPIYHGSVHQQTTFAEVLSTTIDFLKKNIAETILMRIKKEHTAEGNTETFIQTLQRYLNAFPSVYYWMKQEIPSIQEVRGKIVILQDFEKDVIMGLDYDQVDVEDYEYVESLNEVDIKWDNVRNHLDAAVINATDDKIYLTYCSASSNSTSPRDIATRINNRLNHYAMFNQTRVGIIATNFPGSPLLKKIINNNFKGTVKICRRR